MDPVPAGVNSATYALGLLVVPAAQVFEVDPGAGVVEVSKDKPGVGAGNLETKASVDQYVFEVPEGGSRVLVEFQPVGGYWAGAWSVMDADGGVVGSGLLSDSTKWRFDRELPAGEYRVQLASQGERFGTYSLRIYFPPVEQVFDLGELPQTAPVVISNGKPGAGAGNLETWVSRDVYDFWVPAGGEVFFDVTSSSTNVLWRIVDAAGQVVAEDKMVNDRRLPSLAGGKYRLETRMDPVPAGVNSATYALGLLVVPAVA